MFSLKEIFSVTLILFSVIDILGSIPIVINLRKKVGHIQSGKATIAAGFLMILFLFFGESILKLFGIGVDDFAIAGALIIFAIGAEMILGIELFKPDPEASTTSASIVPIAFPLIAGAGTLTTILTLKAEYTQANIAVGMIINLGIVYAVLKSTNWLERKLGKTGLDVLRRIFGIILLSIAIKIFKGALFTGELD
ncbi:MULTISPECIES: MarC family protein [Cognataquiflexum]|jgi:multiple antibiotic resistance protein|uniref:MarC family protein n=1 Tax=Cognataquiflexum TaxID=3020066 RepID=UPI000DEB70BE|nr:MULTISPECIES: MarC family protein [Cognataquiflexum]MCH6234597.1 MarC family protein [Cognataquiflexum rubidum]